MNEVETGAHAKTAERQNRLSRESSPYLLQHASNPVDWYPWGEEALARARAEDKPIFLSIGYSSCHWCHVMAHESFEDPTVAALLNETFVNIKVDREERPDIDQVYINAATLMTGRAGWPLTLMLTPEQVPFFAATYIPRNDRGNQVGLLTLIPIIRERWMSRREDLDDIARQVSEALQQVAQATVGEPLRADTLDAGFRELEARFDNRYGGFGPAPKFPTPHNLSFLLRYWSRTGNDRALEMVERTLQAMRLGGIYDQLGFGFHRYSTDQEWRVPHFEKMLYDQALLLIAYCEAYQATGNADYRRTAEEIVTYVARELVAPEGAFYSAEDADVEGEEGGFYLWTEDKMRDVLGDEDAFWLTEVFNVEPEGNMRDEATGQRTGRNVLHLSRPLAELAREMNLPEPELRERVERARLLLFAHRERHAHPAKDIKILTDWNGLMIAALAFAARALGDVRAADMARRAADWLLAHVTPSSGHLLHRYAAGEAGVVGMAEDYAFLTWGLIELYQTSLEAHYLQAAIDLNATLLVHFWDEDAGGLFTTADDAEPLIVRSKEVYDGAIPSANSVALSNLVRLADMTGARELRVKAEQIVEAFAAQVAAAPGAHCQFLSGLDLYLGPMREIVIAGRRGDPDTEAMLCVVWERFLPRYVLLFRPADERLPDIARIAEFVAHQAAISGKATAYVCEDYRCELPATDVPTLIERLD